MPRIEQAIFTSATADRTAGYQVVATSPGVAEEDRCELAVWAPSCDTLLDPGSDAASVNFHPLPSGAFCVSHSTPAGWEYAGGGRRVYTHCLIVPPEILRRFANNPLALAEAAMAAGAMGSPCDEIPTRLESIDLPGEAPEVDCAVLDQLVERVGAAQVGILIETALHSTCLALDAPMGIERLLAGLLNCLPPECRTMLSFSTGLKASSRRPFRLVPLPRDEAARCWLAHQPTVHARPFDPPAAESRAG
jgi:hypothetical protein